MGAEQLLDLRNLRGGGRGEDVAEICLEVHAKQPNKDKYIVRMSVLLVAATSIEAGDFIRRSPCKCGSTRKRRLVDSGQPAAAPSPSGGRFLHLSTGEKYLALGVREFASLGPRPYPGVAPEGLRRNAIMHPLRRNPGAIQVTEWRDFNRV
jgi:hypothetical protein